MDTKICFQSVFASDVLCCFAFCLFMKYVLWLTDLFFVKLETDSLVNHFSFFPLSLLSAFHLAVVCQIEAIFSLSLFALHALEYILYQNGRTAVVREDMCPCTCADWS